MTAELDLLLSDYLGTGRKLRDIDAATLGQLWAACVEGAQNAATNTHLHKCLERLNHIEAELQLRGRGQSSPRPRTRSKLN